MLNTFELGQTVVTKRIDERMNSDKEFSSFVLASLVRYMACDWGDTCEEDKKSNEEALRDGERLFAVYIYPETKESIWIITEWDRSVTTVLFPEDY